MNSRPQERELQNDPPEDRALRSLLDLCDELLSLRQRLQDAELTQELRGRLRRKVRTRRQRLSEAFGAFRGRSELASWLEDHRFELIDFEMLAALLHRRLVGLEPSMLGRDLLRCTGDSSFEALRNLQRLQPDAPTRASGAVELDLEDLDFVPGDHPDELLDVCFRLSEAALRTFVDASRVVADASVSNDRKAIDEPAGYASNHEVLVDLRVLHNLYKARSERTFAMERWDRTRPMKPGTERFDRRIAEFSLQVQQRLAVTPDVDLLPVLRFQREHQIDELELVVIAHLLFREIYEGNAYADAAELVRLVSKDDVDLLRNRRLVLETGRLRKFDILQVETVLDGRALTGEVHLSDWAVNYLFGATATDEGLSTDDRLDWHLYLKNLEDTRSFFRDLDAN
ncbi:MAG: hypothetical protein AAF196_11040 [Planctomycetota bacterium]